MHPIQFAKSRPEHPAIIMEGSGETVSYQQLDAAANRIAHWLRSEGLQPGDAFGLLMENSARYYEIFWASQRAGTVLVPISTHLTPSEIAYILEDSDARLLITTRKFDGVVAQLDLENLGSDGGGSKDGDSKEFSVSGGQGLGQDLGQGLGQDSGQGLGLLTFGADGAADAGAILGQFPETPIADQKLGRLMLYSSGTTGRPKGILPAPPEDDDVEAPVALVQLAVMGFQFPTDGSAIYLSPAPLYHAAPLGWSTLIHRLGGTVVVMEKFDPERALAAIETYKITSSQWVPTHFVRMLKLPAETRARYDLSSHRQAIHAAAPCPQDIKKTMIEWWGPIVYEYYAGSEGNGMTMIASNDWMTHQGSVGRSILGTLHICDDAGEEVAVGEEGTVFFESIYPFAYHKDKAKTAEATHPKGWTTLGDIGRLDEEGFLYLTDRRSNMIISGGVNIYPQEVENLLVTHPKVMDAAVIGAPDAEMGERVVAVVQPMDLPQDGADAEALEAELCEYLSADLARLKMPRAFDFRPELPREANGKLYKRKLKEEYIQKAQG